jgi:hypothetical protein
LAEVATGIGKVIRFHRGFQLYRLSEALRVRIGYPRGAQRDKIVQ